MNALNLGDLEVKIKEDGIIYLNVIQGEKKILMHV